MINQKAKLPHTQRIVVVVAIVVVDVAIVVHVPRVARIYCSAHAQQSQIPLTIPTILANTPLCKDRTPVQRPF